MVYLDNIFIYIEDLKQAHVKIVYDYLINCKNMIFIFIQKNINFLKMKFIFKLYYFDFRH